MSAYEAWARDHVKVFEREYRQRQPYGRTFKPDGWIDDRKDRELTDAAVRDAEDLWGAA